ncbi:MAG: sulfatase [Rubrobacter sp.]|nr:sulfatase [Rubrobacter sp.]
MPSGYSFDKRVSRKGFLAGPGAAGLAVFSTPGGPALRPATARESPAQGPDRPNIVLIMLDDLGYGDVGCYGSRMIATPNIDRLASGGLRLTDFYSGAPICTPSRAALLTGRYGVRVGMPRVFSPDSDQGLPEAEKTVAEYLQSAGYATGIFGKWHLGSRPEYNPTRYGFDRFFGPLHSNDMEPFELWENEKIAETDVDQSLLTRRYTEEAASFIRHNSNDRPFFAYVPHTMPHIPLSTEGRFRGVSEAGTYGDVVESVDHYVGELVGVLEDEGVLDDTLIIVTSDNGPWFSGSTGGLRGRKGETYEGGMRVPFIAHWPAGVPASMVRESPVSSADMLPTLCFVAGVEPAADIKLDGQNVSGLLRGEEPEDHVPIYFFSKEDLNAVRRGNWKLHVRRVPEGGYGATQQMPQLFDLGRDPEEAYDLAGRHPEQAEEFREMLERFEEEIQSESLQSPDSQGSIIDGLKGWWPG